MFVGRVCPVLYTSHDNVTIVEVAANMKTAVTILNNNDTSTVAPVAKAVKDKKEELKDTVTSKHNCTSKKETDDMTDCYVTPHDSAEVTEEISVSNTTEPTTLATMVSNKTEVNNTETSTPKAAPDKNKTNDENGEPDIFLLNSTESTHGPSYEVIPTKASHPINTSVTDKDTETSTNRTEISISSVAPLLTDDAPRTDSEDIVEAVKSTNQGRNRSLPSGVIALVTAISFAVAIAIAYIGIIVWRRYIEYRYGHRELLVNELEFDTNDLRHFEL